MPKDIASLDPNAQDLLLTSMTWSDAYWDEAKGLLWSPGNVFDPTGAQPKQNHTVRDSSWYALGLLLRNGPGDTRRAIRILDAILTYQFDEPGQPYHGTFYRALEEPHPPTPAVEWKDYDPNWREFIMTTIAIILWEYEDRLPRSLVRRIDAALRKAVIGALARHLQPAYTNIALMNAYMLCYAGRRLGEVAWFEAGEAMAREVYRLFKLYDTFDEYNSPTYYGVDIFALTLWRSYVVSPLLHDLGAEMEALLWSDIAHYYHASLRNICGPWDRSYGMDMRRYAAVVGLWIWLITGRERAPFPDLNRPFAHAHDFLFGPLAAILDVQVPAEAKAHFLAFRGEHMVERVISGEPQRVATAWLSENIMLGAEHTSGARYGRPQFHPATAHWRIGSDDVGWLRLLHTQPVDVRASANRLEIEGRGDLVFQISPAVVPGEALQASLWRLPGLTVHVDGSVQEMTVQHEDDHIKLCYTAHSDRPISLCLNMQHCR